MATVPTNILQTVQTYQRSSLAQLLNLCCHVSTANTKFKDFNNIEANLGSSVAFDLPPRATATAGLVYSLQPAVQRVQTLTCDQGNSASFSVTAQQRIFNLEKGEEDYMRIFGRAFMVELANQVEINIGKNWNSSVVSQIDSTINTLSGPYRFYGDGVTPLDSYLKLQTANTFFKNYGAVRDGMKVYLPDMVYPSIVGTGLNQFAPERNNDIAQSWMVGSFGTPRVEYYQSNLMPIQVSGNTGVLNQNLTVISTNDPTGQAVTQITCSGASTTDANAVFAGDVFQFQDGVSGKTNLRYLTFIGHTQSSNSVQVRATANAASSGGNVVLTITPALNWAGGQNQNINTPIVAGMKLTTFPSHRCGGILGGDALYIAMPKLPEQDPFTTANESDPVTGCSVRLSYGSILGQNQKIMGYDETHGSVLVPEYSMRILVPLSQG